MSTENKNDLPFGDDLEFNEELLNDNNPRHRNTIVIQGKVISPNVNFGTQRIEGPVVIEVSATQVGKVLAVAIWESFRNWFRNKFNRSRNRDNK